MAKKNFEDFEFLFFVSKNIENLHKTFTVK